LITRDFLKLRNTDVISGFLKLPSHQVSKKHPRKRTYSLRYGIVGANELSTTVVVGNPGYGEPIGKYGSRPIQPLNEHYWHLENESQFFSKLEASILQEGFKNPILCQSIEEGTFSQYGTSRLWIAQKHNLPIPCLIADTQDRWVHLDELHTEEEVKDKFETPPENLTMTQDDFYFDHCPHVHLND